MATRSGSVDPGLVIWLQRHGRLSLDEVSDGLEFHAGLSGLAGLPDGSGDMRDVRRAADRGDPAARLAINVHTHRLRREIAAMAAALDGLDALVFTGGIGEHSAAGPHRGRGRPGVPGGSGGLRAQRHRPAGLRRFRAGRSRPHAGHRRPGGRRDRQPNSRRPGRRAAGTDQARMGQQAALARGLRDGRDLVGAVQHGGLRLVQAHDGPYPESREYLGGFVVVDVPSREEALEWGCQDRRRLPLCSRGPRVPARPGRLIEGPRRPVHAHRSRTEQQDLVSPGPASSSRATAGAPHLIADVSDRLSSRRSSRPARVRGIGAHRARLQALHERCRAA